MLRRAVRRIVWLVAALTVVGGLTSCGSDPTVSIALNDDRVAPAQEVIARGAISEADPGVPISVELRAQSGEGDFERLGTSTATDESGAYTLRFEIAEPGVYDVRTAAAPPGGASIESRSVTMTVLKPTTVRLVETPSSELDVSDRLVVVGLVRPAAEPRGVVLQETTSGSGWRDTPVRAPTDGRGKFRLTTKVEAAKKSSWRVVAPETSTEAEGVSQVIRSQVVDLALAGDRYLRCIEPDNSAYRAMDAIRYQGSNIGTSEQRAVAADAAEQAAWSADCYRGFDWPESLSESIEDLADIIARDGEFFEEFATGGGEAGAFTVYNEWLQAEGVDALADELRAALGLPPRG